MKTTTITREYDDEGRCIRETQVEYEVPEPKPQPYIPYIIDGKWWPPQPVAPGWWQYPIISSTTTTPQFSGAQSGGSMQAMTDPYGRDFR